MARVTLERNVKFKALVRRLKIPKPYVRGLLETMWDVANECGNPVLGTQADVELAAEWPGKAGGFFSAMKAGRWIDQLPDGRWQIHDYWHHAPNYVKDRKRKEDQRQNKDLQQDCPKNSRTVLENHGWLADFSNTPTPTPTPTHKNPPNPLRGDDGQDADRQAPHPVQPAGEGGSLPGFMRFWSEWPSHFRKRGKDKCQRKWEREKLEASSDRIIDTLRRDKASAQWAENGGQFIPYPMSWLNNTPWLTKPSELGVEDGRYAPGFEPKSEAEVNASLDELFGGEGK